MTFDVAIVGAGIVGLAHAWAAARRGLRTVVFERGARATGASIRNFGLVWLIGQPAGPVLDCALRSRERWLELIPALGLWHRPTGSLHLARTELEANVLTEFADSSARLGYDCEWLSPARMLEMNRWIRPAGLLGGLWSKSEMQVSPVEVLRRLPEFLRERWGVEFQFGTTVLAVDEAEARCRTTRGTVAAEQIIICSGEDFETLFPEELSRAGVEKCKLQMLALEAGLPKDDFPICVAGGLSLRYYKSFQTAPSLPQLREQIARERPEFDRLGIHVLAGQNEAGELIVGDSHEYGEVDPFEKEEINQLILEYLGQLLSLPPTRVVRRWTGVYARHPTEWCLRLGPRPGVRLVNALSGAGMTLAFGAAEQTLAEMGSSVPAVPVP